MQVLPHDIVSGTHYDAELVNAFPARRGPLSHRKKPPYLVRVHKAPQEALREAALSDRDPRGAILGKQEDDSLNTETVRELSERVGGRHLLNECAPYEQCATCSSLKPDI